MPAIQCKLIQSNNDIYSRGDTELFVIARNGIGHHNNRRCLMANFFIFNSFSPCETCLSMCLSVYLFVNHQCVCLSYVCLSNVCLSVSPSICQFVHPSVLRPSVRPSVRPSIHPSIHLYSLSLTDTSSSLSS